MESQHILSHADGEATKGLRISRTLINFWLDTILMLTFVALSITAVIVQFAMLCVLGIGVVVHVMLHWAWVCGVVVRKLLHRKELPDDGIQTVYGVGLLITLLLTAATVIGFAMLTIQMPPQ